MSRKDEIISKLLIILLTIVTILILGGFIALSIYVYVTYGGKPITEVPSWALPWFLGGK